MTDAMCWVCNRIYPDHDWSEHGPRCHEHECPPHDCFRLHYPHAFRDPPEDDDGDPGVG